MKTMKKYDVVLLTEGKYINPQEVDWYTDQVLTEDAMVTEALQKLGIHTVKKDWSDPDFDWSQTRFALFRTTWDYFHRFEEFDTWLKKVATQTRLINPVELIQWNMDKHYLLDLERKGIPVVPSFFIEKGSTQTLESLLDHTGWNEVVLKPAISGAGRHTYRIEQETVHEHEPVFRNLVENESMLIQPFQKQIMDKGEVSHIVIDGDHTHAVLKKAKEGDYRVQDDWGGTVHNYKASPDEIAFAEMVVRSCDPVPAYARVDVVWDNADQLALGELELVEPELWFRKNPPAADALAVAISKML